MVDARKIEAAIIDYLRREGAMVSPHSGAFYAATGEIDVDDDDEDRFLTGDAELASIDTLRLAEAVADAMR